VATEDLAHRARELLSMTGGSASRSLNQLVDLVSRQVPGCSGAASAVWRDGEPVVRAASHPDLAELFELQLTVGSAPWLDALASDATVSCLDTLDEERWPGFAAAALARGVRCCVTLAQRSGEQALTLTMFGARPRSLDPDQLPLAELLVAFGGAIMGNANAYDGMQRTVLRLRDSVESSALLDQARGVLMHARGCSAEDAWQQMRAMSAAQRVTMTEVAQQVIASQGERAPEAGAG
jgi:ANTAR domain